MKPKKLRDIVSTLPEMFCGWRLSDDIDRLSPTPDGRLRINLLDATAEHSVLGDVKLKITVELSGWMKDRLDTYKIPLNEIEEAVVEATIDTSKIPTDKTRIMSVSYSVTALITSGGRKFTRTYNDKHVWHSVGGRKPW